MKVLVDQLAMGHEGRSPHRHRLRGAVAEVAAVLAAGADASEDAGRLASRSVEALRSSGLFAALCPREVGGDQVDPLTEMELIEAVSALDPSTGWSYWAAAGSTARVASMLPERALAEVFPPGGPMGLIAFQERDFGNVVRPTQDGLLVCGRWPYGTGVAFADWVVAVGRVEPASQVGPFPGAELLAAVVPIAQCAVVDGWDAPGLCGTGTFDYRIDELVVPWHRVWAYPPGAPLRGGAHFSFRRAPVKHTGFALGVARDSLDRFTAHLASRAGAGRRAHGAVHADVGRCDLALAGARTLAYATVASVWEEARAAGAIARASQERLRATARFVTEVALDVCGLVQHGDASLLARQQPLHRNLRDITVAAAHGEVAGSAIAAYGARRCGDAGVVAGTAVGA
jgi:alkylation response protein AidB-like acyl-CoA dehydrogenase